MIRKVKCSILNENFHNSKYTYCHENMVSRQPEVEVLVGFETLTPIGVMCKAYDSEKKECKYLKEKEEKRCHFSHW